MMMMMMIMNHVFALLLLHSIDSLELGLVKHGSLNLAGSVDIWGKRLQIDRLYKGHSIVHIQG